MPRQDALGARSWVDHPRLAKLARRALEVASPAPAVEQALDRVMALVAKPKGLALEDALTVLWVCDARSFERVVLSWRAKVLDAALTPAIGVLAASLETTRDAEVGIHVGIALVNRRLSSSAFQRWFARVRPFLEAGLKPEAGGIAGFRAGLRPGNDAVLKARLAEVV